jgi:histidinol-phosphate/aromatic aminotransferase/cobyric acid decarboxylase-like protein
MPASKFRDACLAHNILVGRDFPPLEKTHCRISLGSREEMEQAVTVFRRVLA